MKNLIQTINSYFYFFFNLGYYFSVGNLEYNII